MSWQESEHLARSVLELGEPDALYRVSPGRFAAKLALGAGLLLYGAVGNYYWWVHGPQNLTHWFFILLVALPSVGATLLWHMYRNRGLTVLVYPTGLLRILRGGVDSLPWGEVEAIRLKVQNVAGAEIERTADGAVAACWLPVEVPSFQIWNAGLGVARTDGVEIDLDPALSDFAGLAREVQRRTFAALWPPLRARFRAGHPVRFGELDATLAGLYFEKKSLAWRDVAAVTVSQGKLSVKQTGKWLPWLVKDVLSVPNPHLLFALVSEARGEGREGTRDTGEEG